MSPSPEKTETSVTWRQQEEVGEDSYSLPSRTDYIICRVQGKMKMQNPLVKNDELKENDSRASKQARDPSECGACATPQAFLAAPASNQPPHLSLTTPCSLKSRLLCLAEGALSFSLASLLPPPSSTLHSRHSSKLLLPPILQAVSATVGFHRPIPLFGLHFPSLNTWQTPTHPAKPRLSTASSKRVPLIAPALIT